jgi:predicted O-linked N-acetylglucosamine transferase (SPINDLY family)
MASALYSHANFTETVAESDEEYVRIAVRLATEPAFHADVRKQLQQIVQQPGRLFEDTRAIDAYAAWIDQAVTEVAAGAHTKRARHEHDEL